MADMIDIYDVVKKPLLTERSMTRLEESNTYVFHVHMKANKVQIRNAVETLFDVKVLSVNTAKVPGKTRRRGRSVAKMPDWRKAFVKLAEGDAIELL
jgi:large subunit ribosomal protein L23